MYRFFLLLCAAVLVLAGCATTTVESVWKDPERNVKLGKVFVLAVIREPSYRDSLEYGIANILNADTLRAIPTMDSFPDIDKIDKAAVAGMIKEYDVDGVMIIRLVDRKVEKVYVPGTSYYDSLYGNRYMGGWYNYYWAGYDTFMDPGYVTENYISTVETTVYEFATDRVLWSTVTETRENTVSGAIRSYLEAIGKSLAASGLF